MATLSQNEVYAIAVVAGLPQPKVMAAVAMAESSGRTDIVNSIGCVGLWQINQPVHVKTHPTWTQSWLKNPFNNAAAAKVIYQQQGFAAWEAYTNGAYARYLSTPVSTTKNTASEAAYTNYVTPSGETVNLKQMALAKGWNWNLILSVIPPLELFQLLQEGGDAVGGVGGAVGAVGDAGTALGDIASFTAKAGNWISNPGNWVRVAYVAGGMVLVIAGLVVIGRPLINSAASIVPTPVGAAVKNFTKGK